MPSAMLKSTRYLSTSILHNNAVRRSRKKISLISDEDKEKLRQATNKDLKVPEKQLSSQANEKKVPTNRIQRQMTFAPLITNLAGVAVGKLVKNSIPAALKPGSSNNKKNPEGTDIVSQLLPDSTTELLVNTLSRARGAALKIAQVISIQDDNVVPKHIVQLFDRVRESADYMPFTQIESQMNKQFGQNWRDIFQNFEEKPFAAASIGQVHRAIVDGQEVAVKIQYPGVAQSIDSDVKNLKMVLPLLNLPESLFPETAIDMAREELHDEVNYLREAECQEEMRNYFSEDPVIKIPKVVSSGSSSEILSTEYISNSINIDKCVELDQETRNFIARHLIRVCLEQLFTLRFMQTDPNWGNYMWSGSTGQIIMLDFGATRRYDKSFIDTYIKIINAAVYNDSDTIKTESIKIGFLTGYEAPEMIKAHVDSVLILGEFLRAKEPYDFKTQHISRRIAKDQIPEMVKGRLTAPPKETYSIHRALAGVFLAATKLDAQIVSNDLWLDVYEKYEFD